MDMFVLMLIIFGFLDFKDYLACVLLIKISKNYIYCIEVCLDQSACNANQI